jgi:hypothetical protein
LLTLSRHMATGAFLIASAMARQLGDIRRNVHNDVMSSPKPPEPSTEERIGEMIGKIIFLAICTFFLWGYSTTLLAQFHLF